MEVRRGKRGAQTACKEGPRGLRERQVEERESSSLAPGFSAHPDVEVTAPGIPIAQEVPVCGVPWGCHAHLSPLLHICLFPLPPHLLLLKRLPAPTQGPLPTCSCWVHWADSQTLRSALWDAAGKQEIKLGH